MCPTVPYCALRAFCIAGQKTLTSRSAGKSSLVRCLTACPHGVAVSAGYIANTLLLQAIEATVASTPDVCAVVSIVIAQPHSPVALNRCSEVP